MLIFRRETPQGRDTSPTVPLEPSPKQPGEKPPSPKEPPREGRREGERRREKPECPPPEAVYRSVQSNNLKFRNPGKNEDFALAALRRGHFAGLSLSEQ